MKYAMIVKEIEKRIADGYLKPGSKLPSIRALSEEFSFSKNTVIKAYQKMEKSHLIYSVPKSGFYVVEDFLFRREGSKEKITIDFLSAGPDKQAMPYLDFQHCINQAIETYKEDMFTYSELQGLYSLREQLADQLQDLQVFTVPERIAVVTGSQQALHLFVSLPFPNGKKNICVEQPTHASFIESLRLQNAVAVGIERTSSGIDLDRLEEIFKHQDIKFFYTVSRFHNPTGNSYTNTEKKRIVELARTYDVYIIEDDYMGDLDPDLKQDPMFAYDTSGRIIYTKSFSKIMLPGLRLGLTVIPETMKKDFLRAKFAADIHTPVLTQGALEIYLKNGMFAAHVKKLRNKYRKKGIILQKAYNEYLPPSATYSGSLSGFYSTIELSNNLKAYQLIDQLKQVNVLVDNAAKMYLPEFKKDNVVRLSVSQVRDEWISAGVQKIAEGIMELIKKKQIMKVF
ncbi:MULTISPECIES: aminotransferase-like domain-containing protein [Bacillus]|uniref:GntR family transcriptional regulator n=2 Tax=Bacillus TaxID=1386 RepID=A0A0M4G633_9BACI|nr:MULTISPECIES: PLP-dependent aminotransferase family protein [Bacillus]ALC80270.1 GntR family transcriptional regulator [Bacillus gobiensis]MBP1083899.1 DNA-binding transcriptional MocR family regulator [Bacillus capparidis]MED1098379.1 PLP-dependent aminotransferase family protein [Bacillus capparidis]